MSTSSLRGELGLKAADWPLDADDVDQWGGDTDD